MNSRFGVTEESYLFDFRDTGKLPNLGTETLPEFGTELTEEEISLMENQEQGLTSGFRLLIVMEKSSLFALK